MMDIDCGSSKLWIQTERFGLGLCYACHAWGTSYHSIRLSPGYWPSHVLTTFLIWNDLERGWSSSHSVTYHVDDHVISLTVGVFWGHYIIPLQTYVTVAGSSNEGHTSLVTAVAQQWVPPQANQEVSVKNAQCLKLSIWAIGIKESTNPRINQPKETNQTKKQTKQWYTNNTRIFNMKIWWTREQTKNRSNTNKNMPKETN